jgi:hypothetical protein
MSDDFGLSSDDEADLLAAAAGAANGKHAHDEADDTTMHPNKRMKISASPSRVLANKILQERFGLNGFRLEQEAAITRVLDGGSAVVVFPTGGGKSLCYQASQKYEFKAVSDMIRFLQCAFASKIRMLVATFREAAASPSLYRLSLR